MARTITDIAKEIKLKLPCFVPVRIHPAYQLDDVDHFDAQLMKMWICKILKNQIAEDFNIYDGFFELFGYPISFDVNLATTHKETIDVVTETSAVCITCENITGEDMIRATLYNLFATLHHRSIAIYNPITGIAWVASMTRKHFREYTKILEVEYGINTIMRPWCGDDITLQLSAFITNTDIVTRHTFEEADQHLHSNTNSHSTINLESNNTFYEMRILKNATCVVRAVQHYQIPFGNIVVCGVVFLPITDEIALAIKAKFQTVID